MSNVIIRLEGNSASAISCITVMQGVPERLPLQAIFIGSYFDRFARDGAGWYFVERAIRPDLVGDLSHHRGDMA